MRATLAQHITAAQYAYARAALDRLRASSPTEQHWDEVREKLARWVEEPTLTVAAEVDRRRGRVDTRSLVLHVDTDFHGTAFRLCSVRVRELCLSDGTPVDAQDTARTLLLQNGIGVPDTVAGLVDEDDENPRD